ncbi:MAG TPA: DUF4388 domain-containing protein [Candidatus Limnocylindria bacterium]|nr:DUF4388 domain-containing protein [Candidatus Limnocylindria bacterium]
MALQGSLRDFSVNEILQLLGTQRKTGCLMLEWNTERSLVYIHEGRIVSTREPGLKSDDPLLKFLRKVHRLSDEQIRGIQAIHRESARDLEDLLLNGRYLETEELKGYVERQILDDLMRLVRWESGTYRFDPKNRWSGAPLVRLNTEGVLIEGARRVDEQKCFVARFKDPYELLGVRDLPDADEPLSEEEKELFGIIDGHHTVGEVVDAAPLSEYEAYEALNRMLESKWIENVGRRDPGIEVPKTVRPTRPKRQPLRIGNELVALGLFVALVVGLQFGARWIGPASVPAAGENDVFMATQVRDVRLALDLFKRERGVYPDQLQRLVEDDWLSVRQLSPPGYAYRYQRLGAGEDYRLELRVVRR